MATTLADLAANSQDKLVQGFVNEIITDDYLLGAMTFDDCMTPSGTSDLTYTYKRVKTPMTAAFRALESEPAKTEVSIEKVTTNVGILADAWQMDRVERDAAEDLYELKLEESKNAIVRAFDAQVVSGKKGTNAFDGLATILSGTSTEATSAVDLSTLDQAKSLDFADELGNMLSVLMRTPDVLLVSSTMKAKLDSIARRIGIGTATVETAGGTITTWDGIPLQPLKDGALTTNDIYAVCLGLDAFHGITLKGGSAITVTLPDWTAPGAVKSGDCEFVCGCALKATKAAGVLHPKAAA